LGQLGSSASAANAGFGKVAAGMAGPKGQLIQALLSGGQAGEQGGGFSIDESQGGAPVSAPQVQPYGGQGNLQALLALLGGRQ
jgi:hypothetical protein